MLSVHTEAKIDPPIQTEYLRSGGATIYNHLNQKLVYHSDPLLKINYIIINTLIFMPNW